MVVRDSDDYHNSGGPGTDRAQAMNGPDVTGDETLPQAQARTAASPSRPAPARPAEPTDE